MYIPLQIKLAAFKNNVEVATVEFEGEHVSSVIVQIVIFVV